MQMSCATDIHSSQLSLPEGVTFDVIVASVVEGNRLFVQQPTHPTFSSLERLNHCMLMCYTNTEAVVPQLPRPIEGAIFFVY